MPTVTNTDLRMENTEQKQCVAVNELVSLIRDKWTILVIGALCKSPTPLRYIALEHAVVGISQRMLTVTLKRLEEHGLVKRTVFPTVPPRVDYELTALGWTSVAPLKNLLDWSKANRASINAARTAYAAATASAE